MSDMTAVSLFAGIGGFDEPLRRSGVRTVAAVEIDTDCRGVLRRHFPAAALFSDITEVTGDQLRAAGFVPGRGILCAGWPCQGNSVAGRRKGMADPRSGLWRHVVRLLAETRPRWFLGENVPGLLSIPVQELDAVPVAIRGRQQGSQIEAGDTGDPAFTVRTPGGGSSYPMVATASVMGVSENQRGEVLETPYSHQLTTGGGKPGQGYGAVRQDTAVRRFTPCECERLQGFPDDWTRWQYDGTEQSDSARYRQLGNAVAVPVAEWITRRIAALEGTAEAEGAA